MYEKLQTLFTDSQRTRKTKVSFYLFSRKEFGFFLMRKVLEDFVEIQSAASSSSRKVSRLRKGGEGEPDFTEA